MKKNKTIAYMMAAMLLVGGTFIGTKAWFTDQETLSNDVSITTGSVNLELNDPGWDLMNWKGSEAKKLEDGNFENLKPGDVLIRNIGVKNVGTLDQVLKVNDIKIDQDGPFEINVEYKHLDGMKLEAGSNGTSISITATVKEDWKEQGKTYDLSKYIPNIVIDAQQTPVR